MTNDAPSFGQPLTRVDGRQKVTGRARYAAQSPAAARATLFPDGRVFVRNATHESGTGTYTGMTQLAADTLGLPVGRVTFELGDSDFPLAPVNGGSRLTSSVGPAVIAACRELVKKLTALALAPGSASPLRAADPAALTPGGDGALTDGTARDPYADLLRRAGLPTLETEASTKAAEPVKNPEALGKIEPGAGGQSNQAAEDYSFQSFGAQFDATKTHAGVPWANADAPMTNGPRPILNPDAPVLNAGQPWANAGVV